MYAASIDYYTMYRSVIISFYDLIFLELIIVAHGESPLNK